MYMHRLELEFDDFWEGCNVLEVTSHPYEGTIWDSDGKEIRFKDTYRVDFITDRVVRFLRRQPREPFLLVISYLEPHFQNDCNCFVAPKGYAERYRNSFIPRDISFFPGDWQEQLPDYYGCIARVDENVGRLRQELPLAVAMIHRALDEGLNVTVEAYPYGAASTAIGAKFLDTLRICPASV